VPRALSDKAAASAPVARALGSRGDEKGVLAVDMWNMSAVC
jgi:hypothetical protein